MPPREAKLFEQTGGSILKAYLLLKENPGTNIPYSWYERASQSKRRIHSDISEVLKKDSLKGYYKLKEFETKYRKECFYYGLRLLLELERNKKTNL